MQGSGYEARLRHNAPLLELSAPRNPYDGDQGVVEEGADADPLLVDGNPSEYLELVGDPDKNFEVITKNTLERDPYSARPSLDARPRARRV